MYAFPLIFCEDSYSIGFSASQSGPEFANYTFVNSDGKLTFYIFLIVFLVVQSGRTDYSISPDDAKLDKIVSTYRSERSQIARLGSFMIGDFIQSANAAGSESSSDYKNRWKLTLKGIQQELYTIKKTNLSEYRLPDYFALEEDLKIQLLRIQLEISSFLVFTKIDPLGQLIKMASKSSGVFKLSEITEVEKFISVLKLTDKFVDKLIEKEMEGIKKGYVDDCESVKAAISRVRPATSHDSNSNPFFDAVSELKSSRLDSEYANKKKEYEQIVRSYVIPGYQKALAFLEKKYLPICRTKSGLSYIAGGAELYRLKIAENTGLFLIPKSIAEKGFSEVLRIKKQMEDVQRELKIYGTFKDFLKFLRDNDNSFFKSKKDLVDTHKQVHQNILQKIPTLFFSSPKTPMVFNESPKNIYPAYFLPTKENPIGIFALPVGSLKTAPVFEATSLMLHEGIPGHHFQLTVQFENPKLSSLAKELGHVDGFVEGWALYAESLGYDMELYSDPYQRLGNLTCEMLRALRMVVDTELHYFGWTRQEAIDFMTDYLPYVEQDIANEVDRYIGSPGQAVSYKVGQLHILKLRKMSELQLGKNFNIKEFHQQILESGTVSLTYLEFKIKRWLALKAKYQ